MKFFKKNFQREQSNTDIFNNESDGFLLDKQHMSIVLSGLLLVGFFIFIAGYFLGKQSAIEQFSMSVDQASLADKIYSSLYSIYDNKEAVVAEDSSNDNIAPLAQVAQDSVQVPANSTDNKIKETIGEQQKVTQHYYAELAGFGAHKNATMFAKKLQNRGIIANVITRYSRTSRGKKIAWYQVITDTYGSSEELSTLVDRLKQEERLKDVRIVSC